MPNNFAQSIMRKNKKQNRKIWIWRLEWEENIAKQLLEKGYLTIGYYPFLKVANEICDKKHNFDECCAKIGYQSFRGQAELEDFCRIMLKGDWIIILNFPKKGSFSIYELLEYQAKPISEITNTVLKDLSVKKSEIGLVDLKGYPIDIGFFRKVNEIAKGLENFRISNIVKENRVNAEYNFPKSTTKKTTL